MKTFLTFAFAFILLAGIAGNNARAESTGNNQDKSSNVLTTEVQVQKEDEILNETLINKIEAAQKEQVMNFVQKKHFIRDSDYI